MPDGSKSPIWFVENVVLDRFKCLAKRHNYSIQTFNQQAKTAVTLQQNFRSKNLCSGCKNPLKSSAAPFQCNSCSGFFHKRKCFPGHQCLQSQDAFPGPSSSSLQSPSIPLPCSFLPASSPAQSNTFSASIQKPSPTSSVPVHVLPHTISPPSSKPTSLTPSSVSFSLPTSSVLSTLPPTSVPSSVWSIPSAPTTNQSTLNPDANPFQSRSKPLPQKKAKQTVLNLDPSKAEAEFLKKELNIAKAKIVEQDTTIKDYETKVHILEARLKVLDEKVNNDLLGKYFPSHSQTSCHSCTVQMTGCSPSSCSRASRCPFSQHAGHSHSDVPGKLDALSSQISNLQTEILNLKTQFKETPPPPPKASQRTSQPAAKSSEDSSSNPQPPSAGSATDRTAPQQVTVTVQAECFDDTAVTIDEFMDEEEEYDFDDISNSPEQLNCSLPSNQLTQLMQK